MASVGSSHNRPTSAEDHEEALLLGCPPIGRLDETILCCHIQKRQDGLISLYPYIPGFKSRGFTALKGKQHSRNVENGVSFAEG